MATATAEPDKTAEENGGTEKVKKPIPGKVLVLFVGLPIILIGAAAAFFVPKLLGGGDEPEAGAESAYTEAAPAEGAGEAAPAPKIADAPPHYFELPEMLVNLRDVAPGEPGYLKVTIALEFRGAAAKDETARLNAVAPRISDRCQVFLRQLRDADLEDAADLDRVREELLRRINFAIAPLAADDVVFKQLIIQ